MIRSRRSTRRKPSRLTDTREQTAQWQREIYVVYTVEVGGPRCKHVTENAFFDLAYAKVIGLVTNRAPRPVRVAACVLLLRY